MVGRVGVAWHPPAVVGARAPHAALARRRVGGAGWSEPEPEVVVVSAAAGLVGALASRGCNHFAHRTTGAGGAVSGSSAAGRRNPLVGPRICDAVMCH